MNIKVLEDEKEKLRLELNGESETLTHLIASQVWNEDGEAAAIREHPFLEQPKIVVHASNPKKVLEKSATAVLAQCEEFEAEFKKALKK